jgi:hypothetical protein
MTKTKSALARIALAAGLVLAAFTATPDVAQAGRKNFSLYVGPGGFGLSVGPRYGHRYRRHYRRSYQPYYYGRRYYAPRYYAPRYYAPRRRVSRCGYWARRCAARWGRYNNNWRGCMRYSGCR